MKKGFTLIEMIITITVIIILSAISVPIYKNYHQDAILAEGYVLLGTIREAQKNYYSEWGNFYGGTSWTNNNEVLGIDARGNKYFTWFCAMGYDGGSPDKTYYFAAWSTKPGEMRSSWNNYLILQYNISLGQRIIDYPKTSLKDWY